LFHSFAARDGFIEGSNLLEVDVENGTPGVAGLLDNPMLLRVELEGSFLGGHRSLAGKEGAPMN